MDYDNDTKSKRRTRIKSSKKDKYRSEYKSDKNEKYSRPKIKKDYKYDYI